MKYINKLSILMLFLAALSSCSFNARQRDIPLFRNTPAYKLACAIVNNDIENIKRISEASPELINFQEPKDGVTPLMLAVGCRKYEAVQALIDAGADVNLATKDGLTPLENAISFGWYDNAPTDCAPMVELLLKNGADPNQPISTIVQTDSSNIVLPLYGTSPLMSANGPFAQLPVVKALVEYGADIDYRLEDGTTAAIEALLHKNIETAHYLIVEKHAKVSEPYFNSIILANIGIPNEPHYPVDLLLNMFFDLDSPEYKLKQDIIKEFEKAGINYQERKASINPNILSTIKKLHPDDWEDYLEKY